MSCNNVENSYAKSKKISKIFILPHLVKSVAINFIFGEVIVFERYIILLRNSPVF